jgi:hypothetical protein
MLRADVYARALRASQNRKENSVKSSYVLTSESGGRATHTVIELSFQNRKWDVCRGEVLLRFVESRLLPWPLLLPKNERIILQCPCLSHVHVSKR